MPLANPAKPVLFNITPVPLVVPVATLIWPVPAGKVPAKIDQQILACIIQHENEGGASIKDLVAVTGLVARSVRRHLANLVETGRIVAIGKSAYDPQKRYLPAKKSNSQ